MNRFFSIIFLFISLIIFTPGIEAQSDLKSRVSDTWNKATNITLDTKDKILETKDKIGDGIYNSWDTVSSFCRKHHIADNLDLGLTLGDMGVGLEVKTPVTRWVNLRAGVVWLPRFSVLMDFNLNTYADGIPTGNFNKVAQMVFETTGIEMDETVYMHGVGSMVNFKLLADIFPVPSNRHWHITA